MIDRDVTSIADQLVAARMRREAVAPPRALCDGLDLAAGYAIQLEVLRRLQGGSPDVRVLKIGATSTRMREQLSLKSPVSGPLPATHLLRSGADLALEDLLQPMIELELAVRLGGGSSPLAITGVAPALDVVDCRIDAYDVNGADMVADAAFAGFAVLGPWTPADHVPDVPGGALEGPTGRIAGDASAVAGGIEAALAGVAADWAARGRPLAPDTVVLTGAWAPPLPLAAGRWRGALKGLGEVVVNVG